VIARVEDERLILDLRTVFPEQEPLLIKTLASFTPLNGVDFRISFSGELYVE